MPEYVCNGAMMKCSMGLSPSSLVVLPVNRILNNKQPQANIMDHKPMINILPFGLCRSLANPVVAAATSAAWGTLTPMPCVPNTPTPWFPGKLNSLVANKPALMKNNRLVCVYAGMITFTTPGQFSFKDGARAKTGKNTMGSGTNIAGGIGGAGARTSTHSNQADKAFKLDVFHRDFDVSTVQSPTAAGGKAGGGVKVLSGEGKKAFGDQDNPFANVKGDYSMMNAAAKADGFIGDDGDRVGFAFEGKLKAAVVEGEIGGGLEVPIPFTGWSFSINLKGSGSLASVGGSVGAHGFYSKKRQRLYLGGSASIAKKLGIGLDIDLSIGKKINNTK